MPYLPEPFSGKPRVPRQFVLLSIGFLLLHVFFMFFRYGQLPLAPVVGDEVVINDASISLAQGHGYRARSFADSRYGMDRVYAHFPPLYPYTEALAFRIFGVSAYSLRATTTLMSICTTVALFFMLWRLCREDLLDWRVAALINALYCTNASLIALERTARMESMVSFLVMLSLWAIFVAATRPPGRTGWTLPLFAGLIGALTLAVHPEAVTALLLLGTFIVFLIPAKRWMRVVSVGLFAITPIAVGLLIFGSKLVAAIQQFLAIARDAAKSQSTSASRIAEMLHERSLTALSRALFMASIIVLLVLVPALYLWIVRGIARTSFRFHLASCVCVVGVLELLLMVLVFRMDDRRFQFLLGPLLVCDAICLLGAFPLRRWQAYAGWLVVALQCSMGGIYLSGRGHDAEDRNPDRFLPLLKRLPAGASVATTPGLWLDFQESKQPFTLIYYGMDGESAWNHGSGNALDRFDVVLLEDFYINGSPWLQEEAESGRDRYVYKVGREEIGLYLRKGISWRP